MEHDLTHKKIIVVGGAGYIGAHVCKAIADNGGTPVTFDNFSSGHEHAIKWGPFETVDLRNKSATLTAFTKHKDAHAVVHLASSIEVGIGEKTSQRYAIQAVQSLVALFPVGWGLESAASTSFHNLVCVFIKKQQTTLCISLPYGFVKSRGQVVTAGGGLPGHINPLGPKWDTYRYPFWLKVSGKTFFVAKPNALHKKGAWANVTPMGWFA